MKGIGEGASIGCVAFMSLASLLLISLCISLMLGSLCVLSSLCSSPSLFTPSGVSFGGLDSTASSAELNVSKERKGRGRRWRGRVYHCFFG